MKPMEFDEMKKIWDEQNQQPLYAINEEALHQSIQSKKKGAIYKSNTSDFALMGSTLIAACLIFIPIIHDKATFYDYLAPVILIIIFAYILVSHIHRKKQERQFDRSILGDLDHAIANVNYLVRRSKTMVWWLILPVAISMMLSMVHQGRAWWQFVAIVCVFILSHMAGRWEYNHCLLPKRRKLEALRDKLTEEGEAK